MTTRLTAPHPLRRGGLVDALDLSEMDVLGSALTSRGGWCCSERVPWAPGMRGRRQDIADHSRADEPTGEDPRHTFSAHTGTSRVKGVEFPARLSQRVTGIKAATLIVRGDDDLMIPTRAGHPMAGLIPHAAHASPFQCPTEVAADVNEFLA